MAGLLNPSFGLVPGAPYGLHYWDGNRFVLADMLPPPPPPPPPPLAPVVTPQDIETHQAATALSGSAPSGGDNGAGGLERNAGFADPTRGLLGGASTPANFNSNLGSIGGALGTVAGTAFGVPGIGTALGGLGGYVDANRYAGVLGQAGVPSTINPATAALHAAMPGIPFTDISLGNVLGLDSARQQFENDRRSYLGDWGPTPGNVSPSMMPGQLAPAEERSFFTDLFGDPGGGSPSGNATGSNSLGGAMSAEAATGNFGGQGIVDPGGPLWSKGGKIPPPMRGMMDPPGPDDQVGGLQTGEGVLTRAAMKRHPGLLDALNKGDIKKARGLLGGGR